MKPGDRVQLVKNTPLRDGPTLLKGEHGFVLYELMLDSKPMHPRKFSFHFDSVDVGVILDETMVEHVDEET